MNSIMNPIFEGRIINGEPRIRNLKEYQAWLSTLEGKEIDIEVSKHHSQRTHPQNNYYWGVVIALMSDWTGFTPQEMHDTFKNMFLKETRRSKQGKAYDVVRSTASLTTQEFGDYVEKCRMFASMQGLVIPDPNEDAPEAPELPPNSPVKASEPIDPIIVPDEAPEPTKEQLNAMFGPEEKLEPITITRLDGTKKTYD